MCLKVCVASRLVRSEFRDYPPSIVVVYVYRCVYVYVSMYCVCMYVCVSRA